MNNELIKIVTENDNYLCALLDVSNMNDVRCIIIVNDGENIEHNLTTNQLIECYQYSEQFLIITKENVLTIKEGKSLYDYVNTRLTHMDTLVNGEELAETLYDVWEVNKVFMFTTVSGLFVALLQSTFNTRDLIIKDINKGITENIIVDLWDTYNTVGNSIVVLSSEPSKYKSMELEVSPTTKFK